MGNAGTETRVSYLDGGPPPALPFESCWSYFQDTVAKYPQNVALISVHQPAELYGFSSGTRENEVPRPAQSNSYLRWTFEILESGIKRLAKGLAQHGVQPGTPILTFMPNCAEQVLIYWAAQVLGAFLAPLNPRNLASRNEIEHMVRVVVAHGRKHRPVVFVGSNETARQVDQLGMEVEPLKFALGVVDGWIPFESLMESRLDSLPRHDVGTDTDSIVLFTSGTTSTPKACPRTHGTTIAYVEALKGDGDPAYNRGTGDIASVMVPNNHSFWILIVITYQLRGATVLFPSPFFEPSSFLSAAEREHCTHTALVPTMLHALLAEQERSQLSSLKSITLGGSALTPEILEQCISGLGADKVETGYGSTEGVVMYTGSRDVFELVTEGKVASILKVLPGQHLKICDPETQEILPRGESGQIHLSGSSLIRGYLDVSSEMFYTDEAGSRWFNIEDQGVMQQDGRVLILGRYKDMIIRGGENIAPAAIEGLLSRKIPHLADLQIQIVGGADRHSGEVPVAITSRKIDQDTIRSIKRAVLSEMGNLYAIDDVVALQDLGIRVFPTTMAGKVQKNKLKDLVNARRQTQEEGATSKGRDLGQRVRKIVADMMGLEPFKLTDSTKVSEIGDSITLMRIRHRIKKQLDVEISGDSVARAATIGELIETVNKTASTESTQQDSPALEQDHAPNIEDVVFIDDPVVYEKTRRLVTDAIRSMSLDWEDVRQITPAYDFSRIAAQDGTFEAWSFKLVAVTTHSKQQLREALGKALSNNPMAASFMVWNAEELGADFALQCTVDHTPRFLEQIIEDVGSVPSADALRTLAMKMSDKPPPAFPGPLFRSFLYTIEDSGGAGVICDCHHAIMDGSFSRIFFEDLDSSLGGSSILKPHVPYKLWCDSFYALKKSPAALVAVRYHAEKAKDLANIRAYIWPPLDMATRTDQEPTNGFLHTFPAKGVLSLCTQHDHLTPANVIKAAHALFLMRMVKYPVAIFGHVDAGRSEFPFQPPLVQKAMNLDASDVGGQLLQTVLNIIKLSSTETTLEFLNGMQAEQSLQTKYACAPWGEIVDQLDPASAELFPEAACLNQFNWLGTEHSDDRSLSNLSRTEGLVNPNVAPFTNNVRMKMSPQGDVVALRLRSSVFSRAEVQEMAKNIQDIVDWMTDSTNWGREVIEVVGVKKDVP